MKTVHNSEMVAHLWANKSQVTARNAGNSFYFMGPALYSYGSHFVVAAHLEDGKILENDASHSNTTSKHQNYYRCALNTGQRLSRVIVPSLSDNDFTNLQYLRSYSDGKRLPDVAKTCADAVIDAVASMAKMRLGAGPMSDAFRQARKYQDSGLTLCAYVTVGKHTPKWPLPLLPDTLPADKTGVAALVQMVSKTRALATHAAEIENARTSFARAVECLNPEDYRAQNIKGALNRARGCLDTAQKAHVAATGRKSGEVARQLKQLLAAEPAALAVAEKWAQVQGGITLKEAVKDAYLFLRQKNRSAQTYYVSRLRDALGFAPESIDALILFRRLKRCADWLDAKDSLARGIFQLKKPQNGLGEYKKALAAANKLDSAPAAFTKLHAAEIEYIHQTAREAVTRLTAEIEAKNATAIADWQAGGTTRLPSDAGAYARIRGAHVETSRGATVPIEHACRLARIARRVMASGGAAWADGAGPMVGGFRVNSIGADGAAVIGCHEFSAAESMRVLALLDACAACANGEVAA